MQQDLTEWLSGRTTATSGQQMATFSASTVTREVEATEQKTLDKTRTGESDTSDTVRKSQPLPEIELESDARDLGLLRLPFDTPDDPAAHGNNQKIPETNSQSLQEPVALLVTNVAADDAGSSANNPPPTVADMLAASSVVSANVQPDEVKSAVTAIPSSETTAQVTRPTKTDGLLLATSSSSTPTVELSHPIESPTATATTSTAPRSITPPPSTRPETSVAPIQVPSIPTASTETDFDQWARSVSDAITAASNADIVASIVGDHSQKFARTITARTPKLERKSPTATSASSRLEKNVNTAKITAAALQNVSKSAAPVTSPPLQTRPSLLEIQKQQSEKQRIIRQRVQQVLANDANVANPVDPTPPKAPVTATTAPRQAIPVVPSSSGVSVPVNGKPLVPPTSPNTLSTKTSPSPAEASSTRNSAIHSQQEVQAKPRLTPLTEVIDADTVIHEEKSLGASRPRTLTNTSDIINSDQRKRPTNEVSTTLPTPNSERQSEIRRELPPFPPRRPEGVVTDPEAIMKYAQERDAYFAQRLHQVILTRKARAAEHRAREKQERAARNVKARTAAMCLLLVLIFTASWLALRFVQRNSGVISGETFATRAAELYQDGRYTEAADAWQNALEKSPRSPSFLMGLARSAARASQPQTANLAWDMYLDVIPEDDHGSRSQALYERALVQSEMGDMDGAAASLYRSLQYVSTNYDACLALGRLLEGQDNFDAAIQAYRGALKLRPSSSEAQESLDRAQIARQEFQAAALTIGSADTVEVAVSDDVPASADIKPLINMSVFAASFDIATNALNYGRYDEALILFTELQNVPDAVNQDVRILLGLAGAWLGKGRSDNAFTILNDPQALALFSNEPTFDVLRKEIHEIVTMSSSSVTLSQDMTSADESVIIIVSPDTIAPASSLVSTSITAELLSGDVSTEQQVVPPVSQSVPIEIVKIPVDVSSDVIIVDVSSKVDAVTDSLDISSVEAGSVIVSSDTSNTAGGSVIIKTYRSLGDIVEAAGEPGMSSQDLSSTDADVAVETDRAVKIDNEIIASPDVPERQELEKR